MRWPALLLLILLGLSRAPGQAVGIATLWRIGTSDDKADELALGPDQKGGFFGRFGGPDEVFYLGQEKEKESFPYALPGPNDEWGGSSRWSGARVTSAQIGFVLENSNQTESSVLVLDFLDTHPTLPPVLRILVNGSPHDFNLPAGGSADSLAQAVPASKEHILHFPIPPNELKAGYNEISLSIIKGSWLVFDSIRFDAPSGVTLAPQRDTIIRSVRAAPYSLQTIDSAGPIVLLDVVQFNRPTTLFLEVEKSPVLRRVVAPGRAVIEAPAPIGGDGQGRIMAGGSVVYSGVIERRATRPVEPSDYVDQMIGTGRARSSLAPGPWMPAGLVKVSPDTSGAFGTSGYDHNQEVIHGFSHLHGATIAGLRVMPQSGKLRTEQGSPDKPETGYSSRFLRETEKASLGRYAVRLSDVGVLSELTATTRAVMHRHTFDKTENARLIFDFLFEAETPFAVEKAVVRKTSETGIEGYLEQRSRDLGDPGEQFFRLHFTAQFSQPVQSLGGWNKGDVFEGQEEVQFKGDVGAFVNFGPAAPETPLLMRMGLSFVSIENARLNLETEMVQPFGWDFEKIAAFQTQTWNSLLRSVELGGDDRREKVRFYSNFYRSLAGRTTFSDVNGQWMSENGKVNTLKDEDAAGGSAMIGGASHYGAQWSLNPLTNLLVPSLAMNRVRTELALHQNGGSISSGAPGLRHIGYPHPGFAIPLLVSAKQAGLKGLDDEAMRKACLGWINKSSAYKTDPHLAAHPDLSVFRSKKFVPSDQGASHSTLDLSYLSWAASQLIQPSQQPLHQELVALSGAWKNAIGPGMSSTRPRLSNGNWVTPFDRVYTKGYLDSNAAQYTWFVPQDIPGLTQTITTPKFITILTADLEKASLHRFAAPGDQPSLTAFTLSNRSALQAPWLFNWVGQPALTQKWTRAILDRFYGHGPNDGYLADEYEGQLSSWFVLTSLGLFQTDGGCRAKPVWELTAPRHASATLRLDPRHYPGGTFTIEVRNFNPNHPYIQKAWLNGVPLSRWWITHAELTKGGSLLFELGPNPSPDWGAFSNLPPP